VGRLRGGGLTVSAASKLSSRIVPRQGLVLAHSISSNFRGVPVCLPATETSLCRRHAAARAGRRDRRNPAGPCAFSAGAVPGLILRKTGTPRTERKWLYLHILIALAGVGLVIAPKRGLRPGARKPKPTALKCSAQMDKLANVIAGQAVTVQVGKGMGNNARVRPFAETFQIMIYPVCPCALCV
jgi:hypothetical protein